MDFVQNVNTGSTDKNVTTTTGYGTRVNIGQYIENKYNFNIGPQFTYNRSKASVNTRANAEYWQLQGWMNAEINFLKTFRFGSDAEVQLRQKDPELSQNNNFTRWNAYLEKSFLKNELQLTFTVYDILNQNQGYQRSFNSISFTETFNNTLQRFWQLRLTWNFSKNGKPVSGF
ncbi:MAG: outer membrane beta-barrel protein [Bacteroidota bacterium]